MRLQEKRKYKNTDQDAFSRLQEKRKYTSSHSDALQKMKMNRAKWFEDEPYEEVILTKQ